MNEEATGAERLFVIVRNREEQWSIWPAARLPPAGWEPFEEPGTKEHCLARIEVLWQDMTPKSLRSTVAP